MVSSVISQLKESCPLSRELDELDAAFHFESTASMGSHVPFKELHLYVTNNIIASKFAAKCQEEVELRKQPTGLSKNPLIESRVSELAPGINKCGKHVNRMLLGGGTEPQKGDAVMMRSNDYLCLTGHPQIGAAKAEAMLNDGSEARARIFSHSNMDRHRTLELRLAAQLFAEDAVLTMSGHHASFGLLKALCGPMTPIYSDRRSWTTASLRYKLHSTPFAHNDMAALLQLTSEEPGLIVVDALYGDGSIAPLQQVVEIAEETGSVLVVDETHSFGCCPNGLGLCEELGLSERVHFRTIGFSKALASRGGVIAGPARFLEAFRFSDPQMIFSTAPKEYEVVGFDATLDVLASEQWRRDRLMANHATLKEGLLSLGYRDDVISSDRQIISVVTGSAERTMAFRDACSERGVFGSVFCPPAAQPGRCFMRFSVHSGLSRKDMTHFLETLEKVKPVLHGGASMTMSTPCLQRIAPQEMDTSMPREMCLAQSSV